MRVMMTGDWFAYLNEPGCERSMETAPIFRANGISTPGLTIDEIQRITQVVFGNPRAVAARLKR